MLILRFTGNIFFQEAKIMLVFYIVNHLVLYIDKLKKRKNERNESLKN